MRREKGIIGSLIRKDLFEKCFAAFFGTPSCLATRRHMLSTSQQQYEKIWRPPCPHRHDEFQKRRRSYREPSVASSLRGNE